ncbi:MAG: hypothetical protein WCQ72_07720, partial [Eubacteriales bacterium]
MGFMDKIKGMVNPESIDDNYDDEYVFDGDEDAQNGAPAAGGDYNYDEDYQQTQQTPVQRGYNQQQRGGQYQQQQPAAQQ